MQEKKSKARSLITNGYWLIGFNLTIVFIMKLAKLHNVSLVYYAGFFLLSLPLVFKIENVILSIPFFLFLMEQAPKKIGINEICFSLLFVVSLSYFLSKEYKNFNIKKTKKESLFFFATLVFLAINFYSALSHSVNVYSWFRGAIPFATCLFFLPLYKIFSENEKIKEQFFVAMSIIIFLYSMQLIIYYALCGLHENHWYFLENNTWIPINKETVHNYPSELVFFFKQRITVLLPEATNPFVPLGCIIGQIAYSLSKKKNIVFFSIVLMGISTIATTMTIARSMLLSILVVSFFFLLLLFFDSEYKRFIRRGIFAFFLVGTVFCGSVFVLKMGDIYLNRTLQMASFLETAQKKEYAKQKTERYTPVLKDENIKTRIEEKEQALEIFSNYPIFGGGFGIKHKIFLDTGFGNMVLHEVGYVHNWFLYILMCCGIYGFVLYSIVLFYPIIWVIRQKNNTTNILLVFCLIFLITYACFFAVFRLINFNFLLAIFWGLIYEKNINKDTLCAA